MCEALGEQQTLCKHPFPPHPAWELEGDPAQELSVLPFWWGVRCQVAPAGPALTFNTVSEHA